MAELTHDTAEEGFHEIQLSGKQLVFLFMLMTVVWVGIFLCGVLVGRGVRAERGEDPLPAQVAAGSIADGADADPPAEPPVPAAEDELTYHSQLEGTAPKGDPPAQTPPPQTRTPAAADATPVPTPPVRPREQAPPAEPAPAKAAAVPGPSVPTAGRPGRWVVQVSALRNRASAAEIVQSLIADGYPAFLLPPTAGSPPLYRIQIGRYNDRSEAEQVGRRLAKEKQYKPEIKR